MSSIECMGRNIIINYTNQRTICIIKYLKTKETKKDIIKGALSPNLVLLKNPMNMSVLIGNQLVVA